MSSEKVVTKHRTTPIKETISSISGYPNKLVIFKITSSPYWWVRYYTQGKVVKKTTKTIARSEAISFAKTFYENILLRERNLLPISSSPTFERCANELIAEQQLKIDRGELNPKLNDNDRVVLNKYVLPFFKGIDVRSITYSHIEKYLADCSKHNLSTSTLKKHTNLISKILKLALRERFVERIPPMPAISIKDSPRGWFSKSEYELLKKTTSKLISEDYEVKGHKITKEMSLLITFMTNTFLRPSDVKNLRHRNIEVVENQNKYLRITTETSKTDNYPIVTMEAAVGIYNDICDLRDTYKKDDFIFLPEIKNRDYALNILSKLFNEILKISDLKNTPSGEPRTLYSLRHTSIMFRLTIGGPIDLLTLARNARTSVEMIDRFYAKHLHAEMNVEMIQSMRNPKKI